MALGKGAPAVTSRVRPERGADHSSRAAGTAAITTLRADARIGQYGDARVTSVGRAHSHWGFRPRALPPSPRRDASSYAAQARANARAADLAPIVKELQASGARSLRAIAAGLNERGIRTPRGACKWKAGTVAQLLARMQA
jgi:Recombinase